MILKRIILAFICEDFLQVLANFWFPFFQIFYFKSVIKKELVKSKREVYLEDVFVVESQSCDNAKKLEHSIFHITLPIEPVDSFLLVVLEKAKFGIKDFFDKELKEFLF